ncbi:hypothetical protein RUR49_00375 [Pseudoxanthobacter sp. M-2]|uniref:hypothetical protein n=1 Tax=Pseudoxanthobacter sp. M-2 TaxID=3078754 RepID=UPI0038FC179A
MSLKLSNIRRQWALFVTVALVATTACLFAATTFLYLDHSRQREMLSVGVRTSGWVAYQAQIELIKSLAALRIDAVDPTMVGQEMSSCASRSCARAFRSSTNRRKAGS